MSYITTFDTVFWVNILLAVTAVIFHLITAKHTVHFMVNILSSKNKAIALIGVATTYLALTVALLVWSLMTSLEGMITATFWYSIATLFMYKPMVRFNMRALSN